MGGIGDHVSGGHALVLPPSDMASERDAREQGATSSAGTDGGRRIVVVFSGHMIDTPERTAPRFPSECGGAVRAAIDAVLTAWGIGPGDLCLSSGAQGGDLLFAEACLERGAHLQLLLPLPVDEFVLRSVRRGRGEWERRFRRVVTQAEVRRPEDGTSNGPAPSPFASGDDWLLAAARIAAAPDPPRVLVVWDGRPAEGETGTAGFVAKAQRLGWPLTVVDPRPS